MINSKQPLKTIFCGCLVYSNVTGLRSLQILLKIPMKNSLKCALDVHVPICQTPLKHTTLYNSADIHSY